MNKKQKYLYNGYNFLDANKNFLYVTIFPTIINYAVIFVIAIISTFIGADINKTAQATWLIFVSLVANHLTYLAIYFIYNYRHKIDFWQASKIKTKINWLMLALCVVMAVIALFAFSPIVDLFSYGLDKIGYRPNQSLPVSLNSPLSLVWGILVLAIIPAICEELIMRGVVSQGLNNRFKAVAAITLSGVYFMLLHGSLQQFLYQFVLGIVLGFVVYYGGNLMYSVVMHFVNNLLVVIFAYINRNQPAQYNYHVPFDYIKPFIFMIVGAGLLALCLWGFYAYFKKHPNPKQPVVDSTQDTIDYKKKEKLFLIIAIAFSIAVWLFDTIVVWVEGA